MRVFGELRRCRTAITCSPYTEYVSHQFSCVSRIASRHLVLILVGIFLGTTSYAAAQTCPANSPIDLNTATASELQQLHGIGEALSGRIVDYRSLNGDFTKTAHIQDVKGIGDATYADIETCITVGNSSTNDSDNITEETNNDPEESDDAATTTDDTTTNDDEPNETISLTLPDTELQLTIDAPDATYVHQPLEVSVSPSGISEALHASIQYTWNFGDTHTDIGDEAAHTYTHAGKYVIVVHGTYARHEALATHTITVLPNTLSLSRADTGAVRIHNDAKYAADISGYTVKAAKTFTIPERTMLLAGASLTVPSEAVGGGPVVLLDRGYTKVAAHEIKELDQAEVVSSNTPSAATAPAPAMQASADTSNFTFAGATSSRVRATPQVAGTSTTRTPADSSSATSSAIASIPSHAWPYLGLIGLILLGLGAIYVGRSPIQQK